MRDHNEVWTIQVNGYTKDVLVESFDEVVAVALKMLKDSSSPEEPEVVTSGVTLLQRICLVERPHRSVMRGGGDA